MDDQRTDRETSNSVGSGRILFCRYGLVLWLGENDSLCLGVICGRVAEYAVEFVLNTKERERYKREGDSYLNELEREVMANPEAFLKRSQPEKRFNPTT